MAIASHTNPDPNAPPIPASRVPIANVPLANHNAEDDVLTCAACGVANSTDSRFCRKCGESLAVTSGAAAPIAAASSAVVASDNNQSAVDTKRTQTPGDETRARHLLDRAFALAERGDMAGAVLACRQSVVLAPDVPQGFSMLGLLLERSGDLQGAVNAYTRVLHLAPGSRLEEESLARLRASMEAAKTSRRKTAAAFDFDDSDLDMSTASPGVVAPVAAAVTAAAVTNDVDKHGTRLLTSDTAVATPLAVPVAASIATPTAPLQTPPPLAVPAISALDFDVTDEPDIPLWKQIATRPTFYWSGLPLAGAALLGLMVMSWGRSSALSRQPVTSPITTPSTLGEVPKTSETAPTNNNATNATGLPDYSVNTPPRAVGGAGPNDGLRFGSAPRTAPAADAPAGNAPGAQNGAPVNGQDKPANSAPANNRRAENRAPSASRQSPLRSQPAFPSPASQPIAPAMPSMLPPVRPQSPTQSGSGSVLLTPSEGQSGGSNVASSSGAPFGANNPKSSGYITLTPPRSPSAARQRPSNNANNAERAAANAGGAGRGKDAIDSINSALQNGGDTGWRYQQRALLFLERGDNQRAADDFQTAIAAYRDQVNRGERVSEAKAGIQACQSGLRLALANSR